MLAKRSLLVLLCLVMFAFANDSRVFLGLRLGGGIGMSRPTGDVKEAYDESEGSKFRSGGGSFDVAPFVSFQLTDNFAVGTEFMFTRFGYGGEKLTEDDPWDDGKDGDWFSTSRAAMVIPVLAQFTLAQRKVNLFVGPHFTINMGDMRDAENWAGESKSEKWDSEEMDWFKDEMNVPVIGLTVGAAFAVGPVFIDIRYLTDLGAVKPKDAGEVLYAGEPWEFTMPDGGVRRAKLALSVGWQFGLGSR
ncbi:MAG: outer membrane beta-barrel protein [Chitinivibrionia bacterium]|jgi:hypothetical protein|nr:outer membrane beta-barrel protein [Chitinivibrionia bacterium]